MRLDCLVSISSIDIDIMAKSERDEVLDELVSLRCLDSCFFYLFNRVWRIDCFARRRRGCSRLCWMILSWIQRCSRIRRWRAIGPFAMYVIPGALHFVFLLSSNSFQDDVFMFALSLRFRRCGLGERCLQDIPGPMMSGNGDVIDHLPTCLCST